MSENIDQDILDQLLKGSSPDAAFRILLQAYQKRIYWHVRKIVITHDDANDVTQNTFLKVWEALPQFRGESKLYTWIYRIATNEALSFLRKKKGKQAINFDEVSYQVAQSLEADVYYNGNDIERKLQAAISTLPKKQRLVLNMKYFDELKYSEMSAILGTSEGALKASYHHATTKIKAFLQNELNH